MYTVAHLSSWRLCTDPSIPENELMTTGWHRPHEHCSARQTRGRVGVLSTNLNRCLYIPKPRWRHDLSPNQRIRKSLALIFSRGLTTHLGTAQAILWAVMFALGISTRTHAQEDVAETKANFKIDVTPIKEAAITQADRAHWSFSPITR